MYSFLRKFCFSFVCFFSVFSIFAQNVEIPIGDNWKYYDQGSLDGVAWKDSSFNDAIWANGEAELGYGDGDESTVISYGSIESSKHITSYFRKPFSLSQIASLACKIKVDDGTIVYLNGSEVFRQNLPSGSISFSTIALDGSNENTWHNFIIPSSLTVAGNNYLAVEMHQQSATSSDLSFDFELTTILPPPNPGLYINEIMATNSTAANDQSGESSDWIEIYNGYTYPVDLNGYFLSDDLTELDKFKISSSIVIPSGERQIFWASGTPLRGDNHLSFALSANGEFVVLSDPNENILDSLSFSKQRTDVSYGRLNDGSDSLRFFSPSSFNKKNVSTNAYLGILEKPTFSQNGGHYTNSFYLNLNAGMPNSQIVFSIDGSEPSINNLMGTTYSYRDEYPGARKYASYTSELYENPIFIYDKSNEPNVTSSKSTTHDDYPNNIPTAPVKKAFVVRAVSTKANFLPSEVASSTYFIYPQIPYSLPIVSINTSENNLFDYDTGIYTAGKKFDENYQNGESGFCLKGNYSGSGALWERGGSFEFFENGVQLESQEINFRIHGGCSRASARKSLRLYGNENLGVPFFQASPNMFPSRVILRSGGTEGNYSLIRDALYQDIVKDLDFASQHSRTAVAYINGEYWGIHNLRERIDKYFLHDKFDINEEAIDLITIAGSRTADEGDTQEYDALVNYFESNDFYDPESYEYIKTQIDIESFIDYHVAEFFSSNNDWPHNNVKLWRQRDFVGKNPNNKYQDGKWRWILFDVEAGMNFWYSESSNSFNIFFSNNEFIQMLEKLFKNSEFKTQFLTRYLDLLNTTFRPSYTLKKENEWKSKLEPYMPEHIERWNKPNTMTIWLDEIEKIETFFLQRPGYVRQHLRPQYGVDEEFVITLDVSSKSAGYIKINTININENTPGVDSLVYPWSGIYFENYPLELTAIPNAGYKFIGWEKNGNIIDTNASVTVYLSENDAYKAVFEEDFLSSNPIPVALLLDKCGYKFTIWSDEANTGSFPPNMSFVYMDEADPSINAGIEGNTNGDYDEGSRTRINGLGEEGISFINTGNSEGNPGFPGTKLGGVILAVNTIGYDSLNISFLSGTVAANNREYHLRLQYRVGDILPFKDVLDQVGDPVEYTRNSESGHEQNFNNIPFPLEIMNKPYVQLLWRYYFTGKRNENNGGARDEIRLDDIVISTKRHFEGVFTGNSDIDKYGTIISSQKLTSTANLLYQASESILLLPGFSTTNNSLFKGEIDNCD